MANTIGINDYVAGGTYGTDDYDQGVVLEISGQQATIAWSCGERTTAQIDDVSKISAEAHRNWLRGTNA